MMEGENSAAVPAPLHDWQGDGRWKDMHARFVNEAKLKEPDVLFIGDSLIAHLANTEVWEQWFEPLHALNFGIGGDETQHILWRIQNGELDIIQPKVVILLVGTNNHKHTPEQVVEGIKTILKCIRQKQPEATILLLTVPPRGRGPNPLREKIKSINTGLACVVSTIDRVQLVDIGNGFVNPDGLISHNDMWDYLHLTKRGYRRAFKPVYDVLLELLDETGFKDDEGVE